MGGGCERAGGPPSLDIGPVSAGPGWWDLVGGPEQLLCRARVCTHAHTCTLALAQGLCCPCTEVPTLPRVNVAPKTPVTHTGHCRGRARFAPAAPGPQSPSSSAGRCALQGPAAAMCGVPWPQRGHLDPCRVLTRRHWPQNLGSQTPEDLWGGRCPDDGTCHFEVRR